MIAAISLMRRRDDVPLAQFRRHWLDVHGPLVCQFVGLRRYVQCHVVDSPIMNQSARAMRIDGFPILFFDNDADRTRAHGSSEMAACNLDSQQFIGAVSRVITETDDAPPPASAARLFSLLALSEDERVDFAAEFRKLPRLRGLIRYRVREQGAAPNSTVPHLAVPVGSIVQGWFDSLVDLECALAGAWTPHASLFVGEAHWMV